jgi:hypothetical protein
MDRQIRIRITKDGRVEIDSTIYKDCKEAAEHLTKNLGAIESFVEKDSHEATTHVKLDIDKKG